jgi:hypothetical protein
MRIGELAAQLLAFRSTLCDEHQIGLTRMYNRVDDGAFEGLRRHHRDLDLAVVAAYGWSSSVLDDLRERNRRLYEMNAKFVAGDLPYEPF